MSVENTLFEEQFKIRASEIGSDQKATLPAICNLLQEIAGNHARQLKFDITDLQKKKMTWVLHQLHVAIDRFPDWRETITIRTWPSGGDGLRAYRDFLILDKDLNPIGRSLSYWLILDMDSRRPHRIPEAILEQVPERKDHVLPVVTQEHLPEITDTISSQKFRVRKSDLDLNKHVNNVNYIEWAMANLPDGKKASEVNIKFLAEALLGDIVIASSGNADSSHSQNTIHEISRKDDEKVLSRAYSQ